jgi:hypothetical protein
MAEGGPNVSPPPMALKLNLEKSPSDLLSRSLARIRVIQQIQDDLRKSEVYHLDSKIQYLNQTYILHLAAVWQVFNNDLLDYGFRLLERKGGSGVFRDLAHTRVVAAKKGFNTPNQEKINELFKSGLNVKKISRYWTWNGVSQSEAAAVLERVLEARHQIAHTGKISKKLEYAQNYTDMEYILQMAREMESGLETEMLLSFA